MKVWENSKKPVETLACGSCSHSISRSPKLPLVFLELDRNTVHVFYFLNKLHMRLRSNRSRAALKRKLSSRLSHVSCNNTCRPHSILQPTGQTLRLRLLQLTETYLYLLTTNLAMTTRTFDSGAHARLKSSPRCD